MHQFNITHANVKLPMQTSLGGSGKWLHASLPCWRPPPPGSDVAASASRRGRRSFSWSLVSGESLKSPTKLLSKVNHERV